MARQVVITADDYGLHPKIDDAIIDCAKRGVLTHVSVISNAEGFEKACARIREVSNISFGIHLNLSDGRPLTNTLALAPLLDSKGYFLQSHLKVIGALLIPSKDLLQAIEDEWCAQIEKAQGEQLKIVHIASHGHLHILPALFSIVEKLASKFNVPVIRTICDTQPLSEFFKHPLRGIKTTGLNLLSPKDTSGNYKLGPCRGVFHSGILQKNHLTHLVRNVREGISEIIFHPGDENEVLEKEYPWAYDWKKEYELLREGVLDECLKESNISKVSIE